MSREGEKGYRSSCGLAATSTVAGSGAPQIEAVRTDALTQQEQQEGGQHSGDAAHRQSVHESAKATRGSRNANTASRVANRSAERHIIGGILHREGIGSRIRSSGQTRREAPTIPEP